MSENGRNGSIGRSESGSDLDTIDSDTSDSDSLDSGTSDHGADWTLPGNRFSRRASIYATAARVAARYSKAKLPWLSESDRACIVDEANEKGARDLYGSAVHLRGSFLKIGQFVSARPDLLPPAYVRELSKLQDRVPQAPVAVIRRTIEEDVAPVDELFRDFEADSASAASLAQVHKAVLHNGRTVAVKVQYPRVREIVPNEAKDTTRILNLVSHVVKGVDLPTIARALEQGIIAEIDYAQEAANIEEFQTNFKDEPQIEIPGVHRDLSKDRVLVMDWVEGENLGRALAVADHETASQALRILVDAYLKQILVDGFLHSDPHPGNFLLQLDPIRLGIVDFGACARISDDTRLKMRDLYASAIVHDFAAIGEVLQSLGFRTQKGDVEGLIEFASLFTFDDEDQTTREESWNRLVSAARENPLVKIPDELIMLGRVLIIQTGLVSRIRPKWRMDELISARLSQGG